MLTTALLTTLERAWLALSPLNRPMALMGGIALSIWQRMRATRDIDVLVALGETDVAGVVGMLRPHHFAPTSSPPVKRLGELSILQLNYEPPATEVPICVDLLFGQSEYLRGVLARAVRVTLPGLRTEFSVVSCEDLVLLKLQAGRVIDHADAVALLQENEPSIDADYLRQWAAELGVTRGLDLAWEEATKCDA